MFDFEVDYWEKSREATEDMTRKHFFFCSFTEVNKLVLLDPGKVIGHWSSLSPLTNMEEVRVAAACLTSSYMQRSWSSSGAT